MKSSDRYEAAEGSSAGIKGATLQMTPIQKDSASKQPQELFEADLQMLSAQDMRRLARTFVIIHILAGIWTVVLTRFLPELFLQTGSFAKATITGFMHGWPPVLSLYPLIPLHVCMGLFCVRKKYRHDACLLGIERKQQNSLRAWSLLAFIATAAVAGAVLFFTIGWSLPVL
ncbi:MAG: hypothetical protein LBU48_06325 [Coriobacteriales bacterium]|nr:hypothetical protein [Coriobacteriales bacterium]